MKLSKLYCNKPFKNVIFNTEIGKLSIVCGDAEKKENIKDSHNLGKTRLVLLIDFLLLKKRTSTLFLFTQRKKDNQLFPVYGTNNIIEYITLKKADEGQLLFQDYEFYLEILLNNGKYLTIKRTVNNPTRIFFKLQETTLKEFIFYDNWDHKDIPIDRAQSMLNEWLDFDFYSRTGEDYRRILNYSLRMQGDYDYQRNSIFQLSKFSRNSDKDWKPLMFSLLGFDNNILRRKYELEEYIKEQNKVIKAQEKDFGINPHERDSLIGQIQVKEQEYKELSKELEELNFYQQDKSIIDDLVGKIESEIANLNTQLYVVEFDIHKLQQSIKNGFSFDINRVKNLFEEVNLYFPDQLVKTYEQLIEFNKKITEERNAQIRTTLREKEEQQRTLITHLINLNNQKDKYRDLIQDTSLFKKFKEYQKKVMKAEADMIRLQSQLDALDIVETKRNEIEQTMGDELRQKIEELKDIISHTSDNEQYTNIRKTFSEIARKITHSPAYISISLNTHSNINFECKYEGSAKDEGNTYYKLLCIAFDLAIHIIYNKQSYFRFIYHDDAFANLANNRRISLMNTIREYTAKYNIQYIFSIIKDDIPEDKEFKINDDEIILNLNDKNESGKLFYMDF